jgi:hypothetical protein
MVNDFIVPALILIAVALLLIATALFRLLVGTKNEGFPAKGLSFFTYYSACLLLGWDAVQIFKMLKSMVVS